MKVVKLELETGIPIPEKEPTRNMYPFKDMEIGQSFKLDYETFKDGNRLYNSMMTAKQRFLKLEEGTKNFLIKRYDKEFPKCIRCWRTN